MSDQARQTPILDLLRDVPAGARMVYEVSPTHHQSIPVGRLAKDAADAIEHLRAALVAAMEVVQQDRVSLYEVSRNRATGEIEPEDAAAIAELDAIIAQADKAMGREG